MTPLYDKRAVEILERTYWSPEGWTPEPRTTPPEDLAYAVSKGVMFPPGVLNHDETLRELRAICVGVSREALGNAFLASLSSRELALRSAFCSFAIARHVPIHPYQEIAGLHCCGLCGIVKEDSRFNEVDFSVLNFERLKWGGVRHEDAAYQFFDLREFLKLPQQQPGAEDLTIFRTILETISGLAGDATARMLSIALTGKLPSNREERAILVQMLCMSGILAYPGFRDYFHPGEPPSDRRYRDTDWDGVAMNWRAKDGYCRERLAEFFPNCVDELIP